MATDRLHAQLEGLPMPLAQLARRALGTRAGRERHDAAFYLAEASLKLAAAARIGLWLSRRLEPGGRVAEQLETLVLPSLGHWCGYLRLLSDELSTGPTAEHALGASRKALARAAKHWQAVPDFIASCQEAELINPEVARQARRWGPVGFYDVLVRYRNEVIGHGGQRDDAFYERLGSSLLEAMSEVLALPGLWGGGRLLLTTLEIGPGRRSTTLGYQQLMGLAALPLDDEVDEGAEPGQLYLLDDGERVPLHPWIICQPDAGTERFGFLNRAVLQRASERTREVRSAHYLDYARGETIADADACPALAEVLTRLRGAPADEASVTALATTLAAEGEPAPEGLAAPLAPPLASGARLGHYRVSELLGRGAMGEVYAANDDTLGREVAIKVLPASLAGDPQRVRRFIREARSVAALSHPNIVTLHAVEEVADRLFLVMERVEGASLATRIGEEGMPLDEILSIGVDLAEALAAAHERGIAHRDLKPQNVMLTPEGRAKVLDFGLAKPLLTSQLLSADEGVEPATREGQIIGTPAYMSPEQAQGRQVDHRSDLFALGTILYEMASGRRPFVGDSAMTILSAVIKDTPPSLVELRPELPPRLVSIVRRCLAKDPRRRYQSARDLASDLEELRDTTPDSPADRAATPRPRGSSIGTTLLAVTVVAALAAALGYRWRGEASPQPPRTDVPTAPDPGIHVREMVRLTNHYGEETDPEIAADGTWFVYAARGERGLDLYRQRVGGRNRTLLTPDSPRDDWQPSISPDGQRIAFRSERDGGGIFVLGATGESPHRVSGVGYHPSWSPDGKRLVINSHAVTNPRSRGTLSSAWIVDVESGALTALKGGRDVAQGTFSPDGSLLALYGSLDLKRGGLLVVPSNADAGTPPRLLVDNQGAIVWTPWWSADGRSLFYASTRSGVMNIWRLPIDPRGEARGAPEPITVTVATSAHHPSVSRDGKRMAFAVSNRVGNLTRIRFDAERGEVEGEPMAITRGSHGFAAPDVSPDGRWLVFCSCWVRPDDAENIYVVPSDGGEVRALTQDEQSSNRLPRWTSDGERIVFYSNRSGAWEIWAVAPDGSGLTQLTDDPDQVALFTIPERDGTRVITWINMGGLLELDLAKPRGEQVLRTVAPYAEPKSQFVPHSWSPDGTLLAGWLGVEGKSAGLYTYDLDQGRYETVTDSGRAPRFLADGRRLIYTEETSKDLWLVDRLDKIPRQLLSLAPDAIDAHVALSPDEKWIYFTTVVEDGDVWMAELEPRLEASGGMD